MLRVVVQPSLPAQLRREAPRVGQLQPENASAPEQFRHPLQVGFRVRQVLEHVDHQDYIETSGLERRIVEFAGGLA